MIGDWSPDSNRRSHMIPLLQNPRYERKFVAQCLSLAEVLARVQRHPAAFWEVYPPRIVNNLYLDTPAHLDYHNHVNGVPHRTKTRVRWYGPPLEATVHPKLERKLKRGTVGGKETYALPPISINGDSLRSTLNHAFATATLPPMISSGLRHLQPALFNRYHRHYFASRDGRFRLTVDSDLQFAGVAQQRWPATHLGPAAPVVIIELKFANELAGDAALITNRLPFRLTRFSKYVAGLERTSGHQWQRS